MDKKKKKLDWDVEERLRGQKAKAAEKSNNTIIEEWKVSNEFGNKKVISSHGMGAFSAEQ